MGIRERNADGDHHRPRVHNGTGNHLLASHRQDLRLGVFRNARKAGAYLDAESDHVSVHLPGQSLRPHHGYFEQPPAFRRACICAGLIESQRYCILFLWRILWRRHESSGRGRGRGGCAATCHSGPTAVEEWLADTAEIGFFPSRSSACDEADGAGDLRCRRRSGQHACRFAVRFVSERGKRDVLIYCQPCHGTRFGKLCRCGFDRHSAAAFAPGRRQAH